MDKFLVLFLGHCLWLRYEGHLCQQLPHDSHQLLNVVSLPPTKEEVNVFARVLSVCLLATLLKNTCMDLDEMLRVDRCRNMDEMINF